jgi:O-antigen biosynthesis protein
MNDLQRYFESNQGRLIHKWTHYFEIYDRHFSRFRNTDVHVLEIGVYHGGSLQMWRDYFGSRAKIIGIDIDPRCKEFEEEGIEIIIGSQEDPDFLAQIRSQYPRVDILIDDGGHTMRQQIVTFEQMFPHVCENGVYLCEDLHTSYWQGYQGGFRQSTNFIEYSKNFIDSLNAWHSRDPESFPVTDFTRNAYSMSYYGSILVIEKRLVSPPSDQMTGHLAVENEETRQAKALLDAGQQPILAFEAYAAPTSLEGKYAQLNGRYFELLKAYQEAQTHFGNFDRELRQSRQSLQETQAHAHNLEFSLTQQQQIKQVLEDRLQQAHDELEDLRQALSTSELSQVLLEQTRLELETRVENLRSKVQRLQGRLAKTQAAVQHSHDEVVAMKTSKFWKLRSVWFKFKGIFGFREQPFPELSAILQDLAPAQIIEQKAIEPQSTAIPLPPYDENLAYEHWMKLNTPTEEDLHGFTAMTRIFAYKPLISIVMPVYNPPVEFLRDAIESVLRQAYGYWELCIADDASPNPQVRQVLEEYAQADVRIKVTFREENGHISRSSNSALELATGEFIALLDHDDMLAAEALYEIVLMLNQHPEADMVYSDEDKIDQENRRKYPFFKPDWCPDGFLSRMYTCHLGVYRHSIIKDIDGFRVGFEGSQDYDLVLRFIEKTNQIFHIPKILYHWRIHSTSVTSSPEVKTYAYDAAKRAITESLTRRGESGSVTDVPNYLGHYLVRYEINTYDRVSIIIPTKDLGHILNQCLESIFEKSTYPNFEVILIDNGSVEPYTSTVISKWLNSEPDRFKCYSHGIPFNYSKLNNYGVTKATGKYLLFLNNDTEVITPDWIEAMVEQAQRPSVGVVGAMLLYPDNTIQHAGVILGIGGGAAHSHKYFAATEPGYYGALIGVMNYSAVTAACLMCRREVFESVSGFEEQLTVAYNDVDFCIKVLSTNLRNVWLPHAVLYHHESKSRGYEDSPEKQIRFNQETKYLQEHWKSIINHDPCYSPHLTRRYEDYRIREPEDPTHLELAIQLQQTSNRVKRLKKQLENTKHDLETATDRIAAMETSKFWQLRKNWFKVKRRLGLSQE